MSAKELAQSIYTWTKAYVDKRLAALPEPQRGEKGECGEKGEAGERGELGPQGPRGLPGEDGPQGAPGQAGAPGDRGEPGVPGERGEPGEKGDQGERGEKGDEGDAGADGRDGRDGVDGRHGEPGRDAIQLEILDAIDETQSYQVGTYARHAGGIVRAARQTDRLKGMDSALAAGWALVVDGVQQVGCRAVDGGRWLEFSITKTSNMHAFKVQTEMMIHRGTWSSEREYEPGDVVVRDRSSWVMLEPTNDAPNTGSKAWKLVASKGYDGKDRH